MSLSLKRAYEPAVASDGERILVDRLWPRGLSKQAAAIVYGARDQQHNDAVALREYLRLRCRV